MGRILIVLALVLGAGFYFPESRARILDTIAPMANPAYRWMSHQQMNQIVEDLELRIQSGGSLPTARGEFDAWLDRRYPQQRSRQDAWGSRYQMRVQGDRFQILSAGPDGVFGTEDDLAREGSRLR
jgi:hypothetical protein